MPFLRILDGIKKNIFLSATQTIYMDNEKDKKQMGKPLTLALAIVGGLIAGAVNGFFGGGGGIVLVPLLTCLFHLEQKKAQASAMAIALPLCVISGIIYTLRGAVDWSTFVYVGIGVVVGGAVGAMLLKKISNNALCFVFYGLMIAAGIKMLI